MSLLRAFESIIKCLECLHAQFFGEGVSRKIALVKWDVVLNSKDNGGLGIESLNAFNLVLLYKWNS